MLDRRSFLAASAAAVASVDSAAASNQVLRIAMTASDLPTVTGIPNNGGEGFRFRGYPAYDWLVNWDYSQVDRTADATPGLFESWTIDPTNPTRWIFTLRQGVLFHADDGRRRLEPATSLGRQVGSIRRAGGADGAKLKACC